MDGQFVENIVHEVKSQGVFDEFRRDSMADVDTKPAYQNLRQRVENTVKKFLCEQKWTPDTNKNQLREKLRRHITESGFLDVGVERIVDQVVNPKIGSVFQPRIEEIAYNYLGLPPPPKKYEQPPPPLMHPLPPLPLSAPPLQVETSSLLPTDLEQVSPESDKGTVKFEIQREAVSISITVFDAENDDKMLEDEDESPPFEPLIKQEIKDEKEDMQVEKIEEKERIKDERNKCLLQDKKYMVEDSNDASVKAENLLTDNDSHSNFASDTAAIDKDASQSIDAKVSQDSQLSSVSSGSRLSANAKEDSLQNSSSQEAVAANISEEAQMPKFNENSCEVNNDNNIGQNEKDSKISDLHFDIKKDEIKFEGTERKSALDTQELATTKTEEIKYTQTHKSPTVENKNESFKFSSNNSNLEVKLENVDKTPNIQDSSFGSSIEDSSSVPANSTPKTSMENKEKELFMDKNSPLIQTPKQQILPATPNTTPIPTPLMPTPTSNPSPITSYKVEKDQSSRHSSSSSSKHKKHSRERRRSHDREKDKGRYRSSKDSKESSSKYYSTSSASKSSKLSSSYPSKSSSSHNKSTEKDIEKSSSSSTHSSSKHSKHSQSSSNEHNDTKNRKRDTDRRHHSSSGLHKEHSSSSTKRSERKDDHTEAKHKIQRRKSTDSNDDDGDKSLGGGRTSSQYKSYNPSRSAIKSSNSKSNNDNNQSPNTKANDHSQLQTFSNEQFLSKTQFHSNVVILNDLLENPQIQFIQLDKTGHLIETPILKKSFTNSIKNKKSFEFNNNYKYPKTKEEEVDSNTSLELLYFEESLTDYNERLELFDKTIDLCRSAVNSLRFDSTLDDGTVLSNKEDLQSNKSNLLMETLKIKPGMNYEEYEKTPRKRNVSTESEECLSKTSPTPSDSSGNSKENEEIDKNTDFAKKSLVNRHKAVQKLTQQQRYSSEDLYKPRPILGQRSRRRGMDSLV